MSMRQRANDGCNGFTIVELMVVISIIAVLMGLLLPAIGKARETGRQTAELAAARQLMLAYVTYTNSNRDYVIPGYSTKLTARDARGNKIPEGLISARYPWRLAPYLDYNFRGLYLNKNLDKLEELEQYEPESEFEYQLYLYTVSLYPSLALNTGWVGGDEAEGAFDTDPDTGLDSDLAIYGQYYVKTMSMVRRADRLMVFASGRGPNPFDGEIHEGYFRLQSPYREGEMRWKQADGTPSETFDDRQPPEHWGFVSGRYSGLAVTASMDGHTEVRETDRFMDMRIWANNATTEDWILLPRRR